MREGRRWAAGLWLCALAGSVWVLGQGCGVFEDLPPLATPTPIAQNLINNPGFEGGQPPWAPTEGSEQLFAVSPSAHRSGSHGLSLQLGGLGAAAKQPVLAMAVPEYVSGYYRVNRWAPGDAQAYLEFEVAAVTAAGGVEEASVRFIIAGLAEEPPDAGTAGVVFLSRDGPKTGEWTYFGYPVAQAFRDELGGVPAAWDRIDITVHVGYVIGPSGRAPSGEAYFDDFYMGAQAGGPNPEP